MPEKREFFKSIGRRKESTARVRICHGTGVIRINKRSFEDYFPRETLRIVAMRPMEIAKASGKFDVFANIAGGGLSGQAGALKMGIARALIKSDSALRSPLKKAGLLTRDPRAKERKKYGQKRARKRFQFSKR
jgi:small subunit ribosomal protein S9